jgi:hypothetical protein
MRLRQKAEYLIDPAEGTVKSVVTLGHVKKIGYAYAKLGDGKEQTVHKIIWEFVNGPIPKGMQINHKNGIKTDNRIENLELVTPKQNHDHATYVLGVDRAAGIRHRGEQSANAQLTDDQAREILEEWTRDSSRGRGAELAERYGVSRSLISHLVTGRTWNHLRQ